MPTLAAIYQRLLQDTPNLGEYYASFQTAGASSVTLSRFINTGIPTTHYMNWIVERPDAATAADADRIRFGGLITVATGALAVSGTYTDQTATNESIRFWRNKEIMPDTDILRIINQALEWEVAELTIPVFSGPAAGDWDMNASVTTAWTASNLGTQSKQTTAVENLLGVRSQRMVANAANGYAASLTVPMHSSKRVRFHGIWKADIGTVGPYLVDSGGTAIDNITSTGEQWVYGSREVQVGTSVEGVVLRCQQVNNLDEGDWAAAWVTKPSDRLFYLPSTLNERFKIKGLSSYRYQESVGTDLWDAMSFEEELLTEGDDYRVSVNYASANPASITLTHRGASYLDGPLFVIGETTYADLGTLALEADTTACPLHVVIPRIQWLMGQKWPEVFPGLAVAAEKKIQGARAARVTAKPQEPIWAGPTGGMRI